MNHAIILAGGVGSRFWPVSRQLKPKQFLKICSTRSMIEDTMLRISGLVKKENIYVAANNVHRRKIKECLHNFKIPSRNFLFEPQGKNTLAPIAVLAARIFVRDKDAIIMVLPSDHFIKDVAKFVKLCAKGNEVARNGYIVTLGIIPTRPETGYGYIRVMPRIRRERFKVFKIDRFIEKPGLKAAKRFLCDKSYFWNSGAFIFRADVILKEIKHLAPQVYKLAMEIIAERKNFNHLWHKLPLISIDYAIMEKTDKAVVLPANYDWTDVGSWQALSEALPRNKHGNIFRGHCLDLGSKSTFVWSDSHLVATLGLKDIIVVDTKDALLVCAKDRTQDVKKLVGLLKNRNLRKQI